MATLPHIFQFRNRDQSNTNYLNQITKLILDFFWNGKVNQVERHVCCQPIIHGGMNMINIVDFINANRIKNLNKIITSEKSTV